ncbi:transposase [Mycobacterium tuberculosis]|nr:transposase [Mycobacterium tuberculosis]
MTRVGVISDEFWAVVEPLMPSHEGKRDLPAEFGPWQTVWKRHHRWSLDGTCDEVFAHVAAVFGVDAEVAEDIEKLLSVDSTNVRAHQHSAGACSDTLATGGTVELQEIRR